MKKALVVVLSAALLAVVAVHVLTCVRSPANRCDFRLRMNELACVRQRINPYDVWSGKVSLPPYYPNTLVGEPPAGCTKQVNAYAPWEYVAMLPFSLVSEDCAWTIYCLLMGVAFAAVLFLPGRLSAEDSFLQAIVPMLVVAHPVWSNTGVGNFGIIVLAASVAMAWAFNRGHDVLAGVFWAIAMLKPQIGLAFAIPLLMKRKIPSCLIAGGLCLALSAVAAVICRSSLVAMLFQGPEANTSFFYGCGTWPYFLCSDITRSRDILAGLLVGVVLCSTMTGLVRKEKDWFVLLMPAAITSCCWTYTQAYSHAMGWFVAFVLVSELLRTPRSKFLWILAALSALSLSRGLLASHGLCGFAGWTFPLSEHAFRCLDSLNSMLSLLLAFALCVHLTRRTPSVMK
jgi:hypothetical protein